MKKFFIITSIVISAIVVIAIMWEFIYVKSISMKQVYIFPKNFKGVVLIIHNQKDGTEIKKEDGKFIFKIPQTGILKTTMPLEPSVSQTWYYFEDKSGNREEFFYCWDSKEMKQNKDKVYAFSGSTGTYGVGEGQERVDCTTFIVGSEEDADSLHKSLEKINPLEILKRK